MAVCPKNAWTWVRALLHSVYEQPDADSEHAQFDHVLAALTDKLLRVAEHLEAARADVLAFTSFPKEVWRQLWSNNPVRHEAPHDRREVGVLPRLGRRSGLMKLGAAELGRCRAWWEQPRQRQGGSVLPDGPGLARETDRRTYAGTSGGTPESGTSARIWRILAGQRCAPRSGRAVAEGTSARSRVGRVEGHDEMLRGSRGEAAGEEVGADPVE